jgi:hypothetical protein
LKQRKEQLGSVDAIVSESHFGLSCDQNPFRLEMARQNEKKKYVDIEAIDQQVLNMSIDDGNKNQDESEDMTDNDYNTTVKTSSKLHAGHLGSNLMQNADYSNNHQGMTPFVSSAMEDGSDLFRSQVSSMSPRMRQIKGIKKARIPRLNDNNDMPDNLLSTPAGFATTKTHTRRQKSVGGASKRYDTAHKYDHI